MVIAQKNGAAPGQGGDGGKALGAAFFIDYENSPGENGFRQPPQAMLFLAPPREGSGERGEALAPSPG